MSVSKLSQLVGPSAHTMVPWYHGTRVTSSKSTIFGPNVGSAAEGREDPSFVQHDEEY